MLSRSVASDVGQRNMNKLWHWDDIFKFESMVMQA